MSERIHLWRPWDDENFKNPYSMYQVLRDEDPIHKSQTGEWIVTRYDHIKEILKDPAFVVGNRLEWMRRGIDYLNNKDTDFQSIVDAMNGFMLFLNPPQHTRIRKFVMTHWNDHSIDHLVDENIAELLGAHHNNRFDLVTDFAQQLPALTMTRILGIPKEDYKKLKRFARSLIKALDLYISVKDLVTIHQASGDFIQYFRDLIRERSFSREGLLNRIYEQNKLQSDPLTENELISICIFLFTAGEETTSSLIGTGVFNLLQHNDQLQVLRQHPEAWDTAIDELLRYDPPVQLLGRIANEDRNFYGRHIKRGETITLCLGSANHDPDVFHEPDTLNLQRQHNRHLAFGSGIHFCMGDWLGKLQGRKAIRTFVETYPNMSLPKQSIAWNKNLAIRSLSALEIEVV